MKISTADWAQVLYETVKGRSQEEIGEPLSNFVKALARQKQLGKIERILEKFSQIWNRENSAVDCEVISAQKLEDKMIGKIRNFVAEKYQVETVNVKNRIEESIGGGVKIQIGDEMLDESVSGRLGRLRKELTYGV